MKIGTNGIITNEAGQVLLIQRDDSRTFAPPGGSVDVGELPPDNVAREVREETGLIVMPVRLVGVYYLPIKPKGMLNFVFRCLQRGGEIAPSEESPQVGFFWPKPLPQPLLGLHEERLERGLTHAGGPPYWGNHRLSLRFQLASFWLKWVVYPRMNREREQANRPAFVSPPQWQVTAVTIIQNENGEILWVKNGNSWQLPGGISQQLEAPWDTAVRHIQKQTTLAVKLSNISGVYIHPDKPSMTITFLADASIKPKIDGAWFHPGEEPENYLSQHKGYVIDAVSAGEEAIIRHMDTAVHD